MYTFVHVGSAFLAGVFAVLGVLYMRSNDYDRKKAATDKPWHLVNDLSGQCDVDLAPKQGTPEEWDVKEIALRCIDEARANASQELSKVQPWRMKARKYKVRMSWRARFALDEDEDEDENENENEP